MFSNSLSKRAVLLPAALLAVLAFAAAHAQTATFTGDNLLTGPSFGFFIDDLALDQGGTVDLDLSGVNSAGGADFEVRVRSVPLGSMATLNRFDISLINNGAVSLVIDDVRIGADLGDGLSLEIRNDGAIDLIAGNTGNLDITLAGLWGGLLDLTLDNILSGVSLDATLNLGLGIGLTVTVDNVIPGFFPGPPPAPDLAVAVTLADFLWGADVNVSAYNLLTGPDLDVAIGQRSGAARLFDQTSSDGLELLGGRAVIQALTLLSGPTVNIFLVDHDFGFIHFDAALTDLAGAPDIGVALSQLNLLGGELAVEVLNILTGLELNVLFRNLDLGIGVLSIVADDVTGTMGGPNVDVFLDNLFPGIFGGSSHIDLALTDITTMLDASVTLDAIPVSDTGTAALTVSGLASGAVDLALSVTFPLE
ncbi:MAG: hypothetical protein HY335_03025 [Deinococcus sp.]|nr:hypothetical protein [Deinococcus sp.]